MFLFVADAAYSQVAVASSAGRTPENLVSSVLVGNGVTIANVSFNGVSTTLTATNGAQIGTFTNNQVGFPQMFSEGLIMTTGDISVAPGPNDEGGASEDVTNSVTCPRLQALVTEQINNPAVLEFDFSTTADMVSFNYIFGSEEYPEFVDDYFNDVFAFFVTDLVTNQTVNVARIPNTTLPVAINNVNDHSYSQYYHTTPDGSTTMQYDGWVGPLTASFSVVPCRMYHMMLAIANVYDDLFDSGVFLQGQSFSAEATEAAIIYDNQTLPIVVQDCNSATVSFNIPNPTNSATVIPLEYGGTAVVGTDVTTLPASVTIPAGDTTASIVISAIGDYTPDTLVLNINYQSSVCADASTITVLVCKNIGVEIASENVTFCQEVDSIGVQLVAGRYSEVVWEPSAMLSNPDQITTGFLEPYSGTTTFTVTAHDPFHCTSSTTTFVYKHGPPYYDTIQAAICAGETYFRNGFNVTEAGTYVNEEQTEIGCDSITTLILEVFDPQVEIEVGTTDLCEDGYVELTAVANTDNLHWNAGSAQGSVLRATAAGTYSVRAVEGHCSAQAFAIINPCPEADLYVPNAITPSDHNGINDEFQIYFAQMENIEEFEIVIYDRWGHLVYRTDDPHFHWDGSSGGKLLTNATLTYRISIKTPLHPRKVYSGILTIL